MDITKFKSTYPESYTMPVRQKKEDEYAILAQKKETIDVTPGQVQIGKSISPIGLLDVFAEKPTIITEIRKPNKMATFGEMCLIWDHINKDLYDRLIEVKYLNA